MRKSRQIRKPQLENQFLDTPLTTKQRLRQKQRYNQQLKNKYISDLEDRNKKLYEQIQKINSSILQYQQKQSAKKSVHKLIPLPSSNQAIKKQLQNGYKQIKLYEKQIKLLELKKGTDMNPVQRAIKLQNKIKQKDLVLQKLKIQIVLIQKTCKEHTKKLSDNYGKEQVENDILVYNNKIKVLKQKIRAAQARQSQKQTNAQKQLQYINKLESNLTSLGFPHFQLQQMKKKLNSNSNGTNNNQKKNDNAQKQIEELTIDKYQQYKNDIKIYKKISNDYIKRLDDLTKIKQQDQLFNFTIKSKLIQKQNQVQELQKYLKQLKRKVKLEDYIKSKIPNNHDNDQNKRKKIQIQNPYSAKMQKNKDNSNISLKTDQKGVKTQKGMKFSDRLFLGKNTNTKITTIKIWIDKNTLNITGIQCYYLINNFIKSGPQNINKNCKDQMFQNLVQLNQGDYFKAISGNINGNNIIQYLVFISNQNKISRFGVSKANQKQFIFNIQDNQIPVCVYGSLRCKGENGKQISAIQQLGFEIGHDTVRSEKQQI